ncbi:sigma-70 family RNA polymerase sigma factor [Nonomuraea sp. MG754425]|uniref:RNA polymerase sigma factor n=1 Tax=Nonomuraea sp. MG754425 TaxID=2570319 RepID=UPI001F37EF6B|nr:sigma-70 region 4 domain-containing protein [Nonomuraea sp. MG754425]MCF6470730.1 sigma-70 family RNA polymerase sigma factor [Nonomuraea sp. MG754425]
MAHLEQPGPRPSTLVTKSVKPGGIDEDASSDDDPISEQETSDLIAAAIIEAEHELAPPELQESAEARRSRLEEDHRIMMLLQQDLAQGRVDRFDKMCGRLLGSSLPILIGWFRAEKIFAKVNEMRARTNKGRAKRGLPPIPPLERARSDWRRWSQDDVDQLAFEVAEEGIERFRHTVRHGDWNPEGGAALTTYFIGGCLIAFEKVYRRWCKAKVLDRVALHAGLTDDLDNLPSLRPARVRSPEDQVVLVDQARRMVSKIKDPQLREVLWFRSQGYNQAEAAERCGLSEKAAEGRLGRARKNLGKENPAPKAQVDPDGAER